MSDAAPSSSVDTVQTSAEIPSGQAPPVVESSSAPQPAIDDPEIEFAQGFKLKRSEAGKALSRQKELERGAYQKMQEAAQVRKEAELLQRQFLDNPEEAYRKLGRNFDEVAEQRIAERLRIAQMSDAERAAHEAKQQLESERAEKESYKAQLLSQIEQQEVASWNQHWDKQIATAMHEVGLPKDAASVSRMADRILAYHEHGWPVEKIPIKRIADELMNEISWPAIYKEDVDADTLIKLIGDKNADKIRKKFLEKAGKSSPKSAAKPGEKKSESKWIGLSDWRREIEELK